MRYREFGSTGIQVSALGFGTMRLPVIEGTDIVDETKAVRLLRYAIDNGVNYIDTAYSYQNGQSEKVTGLALADGYRSKVYLATKAPVWEYNSASDFDYYLNEQLRRLNTDYIDLYLLHSLNADLWDNKVIRFNVLESLYRAKQSGKIKYIGFSFNDNYDMFKWILDYWDNWDFCQIHLNYIDEDYQAGIKGLKYAKNKGIAVNIMEPLKNGYLANVPKKTRRVYDEICADPIEIAFHYLWDKEGVGCVLSDMNEQEHIDYNIKAANVSSIGMLSGRRLMAIKKAQLTYLNSKLIPCNGCNKCGRCPQKVEIAKSLDAINKKYIYDDLKLAQDFYKGSVALVGGDVSACNNCHWCESVCPQHIEISKWMHKLPEILEL